MSSSADSSEGLYVQSHVARDLLQSAGLFRTDRLVVWEYVSNGLQYIDPGVLPVVRVRLDPRAKAIEIEDNGRGMRWADLQSFFVMHGENQDRLEGRAGRGRFGTGKSAAFGIAESLQVTTVRGGRCTSVKLTRSGIAEMSSHDPIPVEVLEKETEVDRPNGTTIRIGGIKLRTLDQAGIIQYIERHLAHWAKGARVYVNHHECEYNEPPIAAERRITAGWGVSGHTGTSGVGAQDLQDTYRGGLSRDLCLLEGRVA